MAQPKTRVTSLILREQFGEIVEQVGIYLIRKGTSSARDISTATGKDKNEIKKALCILIKHGLASYENSGGSYNSYSVNEDNVLLRLRHPRFIYMTKIKYGHIAELIIEELLAEGCDIISRVVNKVILKQIQDEQGKQVNPTLQSTVQKFNDLVWAHVLRRVKPPPSQGNVSEANITDDFSIPANLLPELGHKRKRMRPLDEPPEKKAKLEQSEKQDEEEYPDEGLYWYVNFEKLHQIILNELIVSAVREKLDVTASKIVETMLTHTRQERDILVRATKPLASFEVLRKMPSVPRMSQDEVCQYLSLLSDEKTGGFLQKTDETGGGTYCVHLHKCVELLCRTTIESVVQERFGSKALRIFRLILIKKYLEQKQIGEMAMIPFKESKELLYKLLQENYLKLQEVSKTGDYAPSRGFYLFGVDLPHVARLILGKSYQAMGNMMSRREKELTENKRLLDKNEKIEAVLATIGTSDETAEITQELEELITPAEKEQLEKLKVDLARIEHGEIQVDETIYVLQQYLSFN